MLRKAVGFHLNKNNNLNYTKMKKQKHKIPKGVYEKTPKGTKPKSYLQKMLSGDVPFRDASFNNDGTLKHFYA